MPVAGESAHRSNEARPVVVRLAAAAELNVEAVGVKAFNLARLAAAGLAVPDGFVVTADALSGWDTAVALVQAAAGELAGDRFAVRSSGVAEDLARASFAGQYDTLLNVTLVDLPAAVRRVFDSARGDRVAVYRQAHAEAPGGGAGMAVLVQPMVAADAAGVAFTAHPVTGDRGQVVVAAVRGLGERLVAGETAGEEWVVDDGTAHRTQAAGDIVLDAGRVQSVAALARRVEAYLGSPQDIEWAITGGEVVLLQARPMTALPDPVSWIPPREGWWMRNFRLGEWLPEPVTPLFADWLLPVLERGTAVALRRDLGMPVRLVSVIVNGWYYSSPPPRPAEERFGWWLLRHPQVLLRIPAVVGFIVRPDLATAALQRRVRYWREELLPRYRQAVTDLTPTVASAAPAALVEIVETVGGIAGQYLWSTWTVAGSQWKIEARLTRFCRRHLPDLDLDAAVLTAGLPGAEPDLPEHAVHSLDWFWPTAGEADRPRPRPRCGVARCGAATRSNTRTTWVPRLPANCPVAAERVLPGDSALLVRGGAQRQVRLAQQPVVDEHAVPGGVHVVDGVRMCRSTAIAPFGPVTAMPAAAAWAVSGRTPVTTSNQPGPDGEPVIAEQHELLCVGLHGADRRVGVHRDAVAA